jgi:SSS family solute:Na+ symporter
VQAYLSPAIATLFLFGVFWKRATAPAALFAFLSGTAAGLARLAADLIMRHDGAAVAALKEQLYHGSITASQYAASIAPIRAQHPWIFDFWNLNWLYFAQASLLLTGSLLVVVSLCTAPPKASSLQYTWYGATTEQSAATRASWGTVDVVLSGVLIVATVAFYSLFW